MTDDITQISADVPPGRWAVGVSGGADSTALLRLLHTAAHLSLHVVHLNHETRGVDSDADADFVADLASKLKRPVTVARLSELSDLQQTPNAQARYRLARNSLFKKVIADNNLLGVILAHHADDQAETVLQRLLRGSGPRGLVGMSKSTRFGGMRILRPMLSIRREQIEKYLQEIGQCWREDSSNSSNKYVRNRLRVALRSNPSATVALLDMAEKFAYLKKWTADNSPKLDEQFPVNGLHSLPRILAEESLRYWLRDRQVPISAITPSVIAQLRAMITDAASPARQTFPSNLTVRRHAGRMWAERHQSAPK